MLLPIVILVSACLGAGGEMPGLAAAGDRYTFVINADPQIGPRDSRAGNERRLYGLLQEFVDEVNARQKQPAFVLFNGDLVAFKRKPYFDAFVEAASPLKAPVFLVHGNHDGRHDDAFFLDTQEALSGFRALYYSFDAGQWHFVVLPGKEQLPSPDSEKAMLDWLDADLAANASRPTMVFVHYHLLPIGLSQGEYYTLPMELRRALIGRFTAQPQVRYVVSGHVHCGIQSSVKSSWTYGDTHFVVAPSPLHPRGFGEEFPAFLPEGAANEGYYLDVEVDGHNLTLAGRRIGMEARFAYPDRFAEFDPARDPRALHPVGTLPERAALANGDFEDGLRGWLAPHRYRAEAAPGFAERVGAGDHRLNGNALWLFAREKGHAWAYEEFNERYQLVAVPEGGAPVLRARYQTPMEGKSSFGGGYIRATAYAKGQPAAYFFFHWGANEQRVKHLPQAILYSGHGEQKGLPFFFRLAREKRVLSWRVPDYFNRAHRLEAPLAALYDAAQGTHGAFAALGVDKVLVALGVWAGMEPGNLGGAWFDGIALSADAEVTEAAVDGRPLKTDERVFNPPYGGWYLDGFDK